MPKTSKKEQCSLKISVTCLDSKGKTIGWLEKYLVKECMNGAKFLISPKGAEIINQLLKKEGTD